MRNPYIAVREFVARLQHVVFGLPDIVLAHHGLLTQMEEEIGDLQSDLGRKPDSEDVVSEDEVDRMIESALDNLDIPKAATTAIEEDGPAMVLETLRDMDQGEVREFIEEVTRQLVENRIERIREALERSVFVIHRSPTDGEEMVECKVCEDVDSHTNACPVPHLFAALKEE